MIKNIWLKIYFFFRSSNERLKVLEDKKAQAIAAQKAVKKANSMPTPPPDHNTPQHLQPKSLFTTSKSSSSRNTSNAGTPQAPFVEILDIESISSEHTSGTSCTPDMSKLSIGRGRGRPHKQLVKPNYDDFPIEGTDEEQKKYIKKKRTEI